MGPGLLEWTPIGVGHTAFVEWAMGGDLAGFYRDLRWPGWEPEVAAVRADQGISTYPFLFTSQGCDIANANRRAVPFNELMDLYADLARQVAELPDGAAFRVQLRDE